MSLFSAFTAWGWADILATLLVVLGVLGEAWSFVVKTPFNPTTFQFLEKKKKWWEKWSLIVLFIGVAIEVPATVENLKEAADSRLQAIKFESQIMDTSNSVAQANERAANAETDASKANERTALVESNNLVLQMQLQPRTITREQHLDFMFAIDLNSGIYPKGEVVVTTASTQSETISYARDIRKLLTDYGYGCPQYPDVVFEPQGQAILLGHNRDASVILTPPYTNNVPAYIEGVYQGFKSISIKTAVAHWEPKNIPPYGNHLVVTVEDRN